MTQGSLIHFENFSSEKLKIHYLDELENQSICIIREAYNKFKRLAVLCVWSVGKDSTVLI